MTKNRRFWNIVKNQDTGENEIRIDGDIGWSFWGWLMDQDQVTAQNFRKDLKQFKNKDIVLWINSNGGSVFEASQIYTALKEHKGKVTIKIDGTAISAASVIAMAGDEILMSPTSVIMIHNPLVYAEGEAKDMQQAIDVLNEVKETIMNAYERKTSLPRDKISQLMDSETWMSPKKAVKLGFADGVLYEEEHSDDAYNGMMRGAQAVFNSFRYTKPSQEELENLMAPKVKQPSDALFSLYASQIQINRNEAKR